MVQIWAEILWYVCAESLSAAPLCWAYALLELPLATLTAALQTVLGESQHDTLQPSESLSTAL